MKCDHDYIQWVYREFDDSMWDVTVCEICGDVTRNEETSEYDCSEYEPGFNHVRTE